MKCKRCLPASISQPFCTICGYSTVTIRMAPVGYHLKEIERGAFGEISKIREEFEEFMDATDQGVAVMQLVELSDMLGAIEGWLQKYHPNVTLEQLCRMKDVTARAFRNGKRK